MQEYTALAQYTQTHMWWVVGITFATAWVWRMTLKNKPGNMHWLKGLLVINNLMIGYLYLSGVLTSGCLLWGTTVFGWIANAAKLQAFLFFATALFWLLDLVLGRTDLKLARSPIVAILSLLICTLGLIFPAVEWLFGHRFPNAQAFGIGSIPLLLFSAGLVGGARPRTWLGKVLVLLFFLCAVDSGCFQGMTAGHKHYWVVFGIAGLALLFTWINPKPKT